MRLLSLALVLVFCISNTLAAYYVTRSAQTPWGTSLSLKLQAGTEGPYGADLQQLVANIYYMTSDIVRIQIIDPNNNDRWQVPNVTQIENPSKKPATLNYKVSWTASPFGVAVTRRVDGAVLFNSTPSAAREFNALIYEDQYLEWSTHLPVTPVIYGLGERITRLKLDATNQTYSLYSRDRGTPAMLNLYGVHPFYLEMRDRRAHGVFLLNSNGMDVQLTSGQLTYRVMGGVVDQFVMIGDTPSEVIGQYMQVIGRPHLPPYWALGWHQCRWGYHDLDEVIDVVNNYTYYGIPLDTMWNDIDYMDQYKDFTTDPVRYPLKRMSDFIKKLHDDGKHYMMIVDPGIFPEKGYAPYDEGVKDDLFIKSSNGSYFLGKVWPGYTNFPDFTHPKTAEYWKNQIVTFHQSGIEFDGLWIDMNEIANFCDGECGPSESRAIKSRDGRFDPDNPPFKIVNGGDALDSHTISLSARHYSTLEYNVHSLYGHLEGIATKNALESYLQQRSVVIGRSTFAGTGHNSAHWLGDNYSTFQAMYESIAGILTMNLFGITLVGADICGFNGDTTEEICTRWIELGAFYPFARDHNSVDQRSQEPYAFGPKLAKISRDVLLIRYSILPYLYTQFFTAHVTGMPVARALFFEFPADDNCLEIDAQYLLGASLLITPVLTQGATSVQGYFPPAAVWYDFYSGAPADSGMQTLDAPIDKINLHLRGESVLVLQEPALTTTAARKNPFKLLVALSASGEANGELYWDDGVSLNVVETGSYSHVIYSVKNSQLKATLEQNGYTHLAALSLQSVRVSGVTSPVTSVLVNGQPVKGVVVSYNSQLQVLAVSGLNISMGSEFTLQWS